MSAGAVEECTQNFIEMSSMENPREGRDKESMPAAAKLRSDELRVVGLVNAQVCLEEMTWNQGAHSFSLSCQSGGKCTVSKDEAEAVNLISSNICSLIIELLH
jgi:diphthamide biosynthesis protein 4